ncbi:unnamed protein product [Schistosoma spindalis]|nr:unnamed protein product [Schistosoma spindale]
MTRLESNWKGYGYNSGVLLLDLSKLRSTNWNHLWLGLTRRAIERQGYLTTSEQDTINLVLFEFNYILHEIPCEWNIQLSGGSDEQRCPVSWLTYNELKKRNYTTNFKQPKLIHINHHIKPDDVKVNDTPTEYIDQSDITLKHMQNKKQENKIHIVIIFDGDRGLQYLNSLLKSIFYYQNGRFRCDLKACCLSKFCDRFIDDCHTVMNSGSTTYTTVFNFLITTIASNSQLLNLMNTWKLHNMEYHFYSCSDYLVIVLDIDILLNTDIIELWNHFEYFKETQYIINLVLFEFNYILHEIPCEWNIQLSGGSDEQRCPVSWLTYNELKKRNYTTNFKQPKLIHINHHIKPDDVKVNDTPTEYIDQSDIILKQNELYDKFVSVYRQYTRLHESCFQ